MLICATIWYVALIFDLFLPSSSWVISLRKVLIPLYHITHSAYVILKLPPKTNWFLHSRWLAPLLTQTLPLPSVIVVWDALFACQMRDRQNLKLEFLVDVCTAMLLRARTALLRSASHVYTSF